MTDDEIFDADRAEKTVKVRYKGVVQQVTVREMLPEEYARLAKEVIENLGPVKEGQTRDMLKAQEMVDKVLAVSLFNPDGDLIPPSAYSDWNKKTRMNLFNICLDLNGMTKEAAEEAKKDSAAKTDSGSGSPRD